MKKENIIFWENVTFEENDVYINNVLYGNKDDFYNDIDNNIIIMKHQTIKLNRLIDKQGNIVYIEGEMYYTFNDTEIKDLHGNTDYLGGYDENDNLYVLACDENKNLLNVETNEVFTQYQVK
jgi:hypothetical protein